MAETAVLSSLKNAKGKLEMKHFPFEDLPKDRSDPLWIDIKKECDLTLPEVSALKNEIAGTTFKSVNAILLFVDSYSNLFDVSRLQQRLVLLRRKSFASLHSI